MICPFCGHNDDKVIDSRASEAGRVIRRRRQCLACSRRFTTYERIEDSVRLTVIKKDGSRDPFSREKLLSGIRAACGKRPIAEDIKTGVVDAVEDELHRRFDREVKSTDIGQAVANKLRDVDHIAYVRFASEYYTFRDVSEIEHMLQELKQHVKDVKGQQTLTQLVPKTNAK